MSLTALIAEAFSSGKIVITEKKIQQLEIAVEDKKININVFNKQLLREIAESAWQSTFKDGVRRGLQKVLDQTAVGPAPHSLIKDLVEDLRNDGVTLTISYKGNRVATIGSEADSKLTRLVTGTKGLEINSPRKLAELLI